MIKKILLIVLVLVVLFLIFRNIDFKPKDLVTETGETTTFTPSPDEFVQQAIRSDSYITWFGENKIQAKSHTGTLKFNEEVSFIGLAPKNEAGDLEVVGGAFTVDMTTLAGGEGEPEMLVNHLRSADFFDVETHKEASFVVTEKGEGQVKGLLTIKGKVNEVTAPYTMEAIGGGYKIEGSFEINRTLWDITTLSGTFFGDLGDSVVEDIVKLDFVLLTESEA